MGSLQSYLSSELAVTLVVAVGALGLGYTLRSTPSPLPAVTDDQKDQGSKKKKKKKGKSETSREVEGSATPRPESTNVQVVPFPDVVPGQFDSTQEVPDAVTQSITSIASKSKKGKKKKGKGQEAESTTLVPRPSVEQEDRKPKPSKSKAQSSSKSSQQDLAGSLHQSSISVDTDGSWTRVEPRRKGDSARQEFEATTSDAGLTTSITGNSSPVAERAEDTSLSPNPRDSGENRRTLAEKLLPKARKTGVEDLLDTPDVPTLSRVMRIKPGPDEKPASGFSWGDYEDVRVTDGGENDADGEDDGWGVVKSRRSKTDRQPSSSTSQPQKSTSPTPEAPTKRQRQNAQKRDAQKAAKAVAEEERLAALARHKRELERLRIAEQSKKPSGKTISGGMKASVDEHGKLVWE